ncbi:nicotinate-nucleotide pyrophosphorylase [carboxylating]-like [Panonychus citri]|uniref:nicotinate-nucleotide pyrophosphorylase [carboxylating]-like n=1 Tax=Panonychus citri TaxID=50023 RepID=UPI002307C40F|nr:nicotinate-nucleotide pyrophosphorylase [carboxylating]-like [Panonychus citri]
MFMPTVYLDVSLLPPVDDDEDEDDEDSSSNKNQTTIQPISTRTSMDQLINPIVLKELASQWIKEDCPNFDFHPIINGTRTGIFNIYCKAQAVLAGKPFIQAICDELKLTIEWVAEEGDIINGFPDHGTKVASLVGQISNLLLAERTILNVLSRCSGVATRANRIREMIQSINDKVALAGTRKTTPGFRLVEKYGLMVSGALTHRYDLSNMVMIKDNHVDIVGDALPEYIETVRRYCGFFTKIEVECRNFEEVKKVAPLGVDIIMLDNFAPEAVSQSANWIKNNHPSIMVEVSGGINEENLEDYVFSCVDVISMGSLVQGYSTIDFSMKFDKFKIV